MELNLFFFLTFSRWLKELKSFFLTQRIEPFLFSNVTQRIEIFFSQNVSKNWTSLSYELFCTWLRELNFFSQFDSKSWAFFSIWLKELNHVLHMIQSFFLLRLKELNLLLFDSKNWAFFLLDAMHWIFSRLPQRIEPFSKYGSKNWIGFSNVTQRIELFFSDMTHRIDPFLDDPQNWTYLNMTQGIWTFFFKYDSKIFFLKPQRIECFFNISQRTVFFYDSKDWFFLRRKELNLFWFWLKELNLFFIWLKEYEKNLFEYDSKNWTSFLNTTQRIEAIFFLNVTQKLKFFWLKKVKKLNFLFWKLKIDFFLMTGRIEPVFFNMTQRIEPFFFQFDSKIF